MERRGFVVWRVNGGHNALNVLEVFLFASGLWVFLFVVARCGYRSVVDPPICLRRAGCSNGS